jgi:hypothetical protein
MIILRVEELERGRLRGLLRVIPPHFDSLRTSPALVTWMGMHSRYGWTKIEQKTYSRR